MARRLSFYQIDAFADRPFRGNQACVIPLEAFLPDAVLQAIAAENNVAETAFIVPTGEGVWDLRWFTPAIEVPLCGHATLAAAHMLFHEMGFVGKTIAFDTRRSGRLTVEESENGLTMDFPRPEVREIDIGQDVVTALGARPVRAWAGPFYAALFANAADILALAPDFRALAKVGVEAGEARAFDVGNIGCMAPGGEGVDVTSRFFAPGSGIDEDPATGSWHCMLAAIMSPELRRDTLRCYQAFAGRGADIETELAGDRVRLTGKAVTVIRGEFSL